MGAGHSSLVADTRLAESRLLRSTVLPIGGPRVGLAHLISIELELGLRAYAGAESFTEHSIDVSANGAARVAAADIDRDGDLVIVAVAEFGDMVIWFENDGEQNFTRGLNAAADGAADLNHVGLLELVAVASLADRSISSKSRSSESLFQFRAGGPMVTAPPIPEYSRRMVSLAPARSAHPRPCQRSAIGDRDAEGPIFACRPRPD